MALSDKLSLVQLRTLSRNELMDPNSRWWSDTQLNDLIDAWQNYVQEWFEFVWSTATVTVTAIGTTTTTAGIELPAGTASVILTSIATDMLRPDAFYWITSGTNNVNTNGVRLVARDKQDLDILKRDWRNSLPGNPPLAVYQDSVEAIVLWPPPSILGTLIAEYPKHLCFADDTTLMEIPAWTKYSCANYVAYRALLAHSPNQDLQRAAYYKSLFQRQMERYRRNWDAYLPFHYQTLRPPQASDKYTADILNPGNQTMFPR